MSRTNFLLVAVGSILVFVGAGCTSGASRQTSNNENPTVEIASAPLSSATNSDVKEFTMTAKNWEFDPTTITVNRGDTVRIKITSTDVEHGFALNDFNVKVNLMPGVTETVEFVADKSGTFSFYCSVFCGAGHRQMRGELIVK